MVFVFVVPSRRKVSEELAELALLRGHGGFHYGSAVMTLGLCSVAGAGSLSRRVVTAAEVVGIRLCAGCVEL